MFIKLLWRKTEPQLWFMSCPVLMYWNQTYNKILENNTAIAVQLKAEVLCFQLIYLHLFGYIFLDLLGTRNNVNYPTNRYMETINMKIEIIVW